MTAVMTFGYHYSNDNDDDEFPKFSDPHEFETTLNVPI
jgi:hypothetical protein